MADRLGAGFHPDHSRHTRAWLVQCLVERDLLDDAEHELTTSGVPIVYARLLMARARLRLAQQRPAEALADLQECGRRLARRQVLHPNHLPWQAWSAVALLRLGRAEEARAEAAAALAVAREFGSVRAEGLALWASGLVEHSADLLAEALVVLQRVSAPLERARALVDLGAAVRRANRRAEARVPLEEGLQLAHECGADALVAAATMELAATGVHLRRPAVTGGPDVADPHRAADRRTRCGGRVQPGHRAGAVHHAEDGGEPPRQRLPQARRGGPRRAGRGPRFGVLSPSALPVPSLYPTEVRGGEARRRNCLHGVRAENPVTVSEQHVPGGRPRHHRPDESLWGARSRAWVADQR